MRSQSQQGFLIQLENPVRSFFPGQTIIGQVVVANDKPKDFVKNISILFEGKARVHWTESHSVTTGSGRNKRTEQRTIHYTAEEKYFTCKIVLFGNDSKVTLPSGTFYYPFQFTLPANLPSSYSTPSGIGLVHYLMEAKMKRVWHKSDMTSIVPFTVNGILDLNKEIGVDQAVELKKQKNICCFCCKSGPVGYLIKVPRKGFVPGEYAQFTVEMINMSRRKVKSVRVFLVQHATFHADGRSNRKVTVICDAFGPSMEPGETDSWGGNVLKIPPIPPTRLASCRIIDIQYALNFEMNISGPSLNLRAEIPITIGTIPLRNTFINLMPSAGVSVASAPSYNPNFDNHSTNGGPGPSSSTNMNFPMPSAPLFDMYPDLPPPTYAEAMNLSFGESNQDAGLDDNSKGKINVAFSPGKNDKRSVSGQNDNNVDVESNSPSAPVPPQGATAEEINFVPNYITYGFYNNNGT